MAKPLHIWLKNLFSTNCYLGVLEKKKKKVKVIGKSHASYYTFSYTQEKNTNVVFSNDSLSSLRE